MTFQELLLAKAREAGEDAEKIRSRLPTDSQLSIAARLQLLQYHYKLELQRYFQLWSLSEDGSRPAEKTCLVGDMEQPEEAMVERIAVREPRIVPRESDPKTEARALATMICNGGPRLRESMKKIEAVVEQEKGVRPGSDPSFISP